MKVWKTLKDNFVSFFEEFHQNDKLVKELNSSFLMFISKKTKPMELKDFRPIILIGCVYNRLKAVMLGIISDT